MTNTFSRYTATATSTNTVITTVGAGKVVVIIGVLVINITNEPIYVTLKVAGKTLMANTSIPVRGIFSPLDGKINLIAGDTIEVISSAPNSADIIISVMEIT